MRPPAGAGVGFVLRCCCRLEPNTNQHMNVESNNVEAALIFLKNSYVGRIKELAEKLGLNRSTVSVFLTKQKAPKKHHKAILHQWRVENGLEKPTESNVGSGAPQPLGHIPFRGRDWSMDVPVYAEESLNDAVLKAVDRLLCVARGGTTAPPSPNKSAAEAITAPKNGLEFTGNATSDGKRP